LESLLEDIEKTATYGPALLESVSVGFIKTASRPLTKESKASIKDRILIPENLKDVIVPKLNAEIWKLLPSQAKIFEIKHQQTQEVLRLSLSAFATIANTMATNKKDMPATVVSSVIKQAIDGGNLIDDQFQAISTRRRYDIKKHLNPEYSGICSAQTKTSEWLFGADLAENLKSTKATSTLMRNSVARKDGRFTPYPRMRPVMQGQFQSSSLNWNRPLYQQYRASGHQSHRFARPQGQNRMLYPSSQSFQHRVRKS